MKYLDLDSKNEDLQKYVIVKKDDNFYVVPEDTNVRTDNLYSQAVIIMSQGTYEASIEHQTLYNDSTW